MSGIESATLDLGSQFELSAMGNPFGHSFRVYASQDSTIILTIYVFLIHYLSTDYQEDLQGDLEVVSQIIWNPLSIQH